MSVIKWKFPEGSLRASVLLAGLIGLLIVTCLAFVICQWVQLGPMYLVKALVFFFIIMLFVFSLVREYHPFLKFGFANYITMVRASLVVLVASFIGESETTFVAWVATVIAMSIVVLDGLDGWLARRSKMVSAFGARFDVETDALLIMTMSVLVWQHEKVGMWVLLGGFMRYAFVFTGLLLQWVAAELTPTRRAKIMSVCYMVGLSVALLPFVMKPFSVIVVGSSLLALTFSFAIDVYRLWQKEQGFISG